MFHIITKYKNDKHKNRNHYNNLKEGSRYAMHGHWGGPRGKEKSWGCSVH